MLPGAVNKVTVGVVSGQGQQLVELQAHSIC
jgi:hypothetical protein